MLDHKYNLLEGLLSERGGTKIQERAVASRDKLLGECGSVNGDGLEPAFVGTAKMFCVVENDVYDFWRQRR